MAVAKLSTSTRKDSHELSRKLAGMREDSSDKLPFYLEREARHCSPSLPHQTLSAVSACPDMLNHKQKVEGTSATESKFSNTYFRYKKPPTKETHVKTDPDLHVKSWCIIKIHRILKENVYWTNLTSVLENFRSPRNKAEKNLLCVPEENPNHRKPVSHGLQLLRKL